MVMGTMTNYEPNPEYERAVGVVVLSRRASTSFLQRALGIGYNAAAKHMEAMHDAGIVSSPNWVGKREVMIAARNEGAKP